MKKILKIFIGIVVSLILIGIIGVTAARFIFPSEFKFAVTAVKQFGLTETVKLAYDFLTGNSPDEQSFMKSKAENDRKLKETIINHGFTITDEQLDLFNSGTLNEDEIADVLMGKTPEPLPENIPENFVGEMDDKQPQTNQDENKDKEQTPVDVPDNKDQQQTVPKDENKPSGNDNGGNANNNAETTHNQNNSNSVNSNTANTQDPQVAKLVAKMYVLKSRYMGEIERIVGNMKAEYVTYPASERTTSLKADIATKYMNEINAMEAQCDAQVNAIVTELRSVLKKNGGDTSLADAILTAYQNEKSTTKSYYIGRYAD